ncbi:MAG: hypothetical protein ABJA71_15375 [Ginsengibacter sp.]
MKKNQLVSFFIKAIKFIAVFLLIDFSLGAVAKYLFFHQSSGKYARITYSLEKVNADVLIFGSSHANRHYVPAIFEKKLKLSCYNAGVQGQQILFHSAMEQIIVNRIKPKIIVLNIDENWLFQSKESYDRLADLHPYYSNYSNVIRPILNLKSKFDYLILFIKSYKFNSTIVHIIKYFFQPQLSQKGYNPLYGKLSTPKFKATQQNIKQNTDTVKKPIDINFVNALYKFIEIATKNNIKLFFVASPTINGIQIKNESNDMIKEIIKKSRVPFIEFSSNENFIGKYELFNDASHLNNDGAILFSSLLSDSIYNRINAGNLLANGHKE